ncbi:MAG TPA: aminoacyl-tRNA hydrolase [Chloroflexota bacterium]|nr:aminoacyl-tRNA hydrolase [Chloroflexota bacterium]
MWLVVGLGNPGRRYAPTRHNIGFRVVDRLAERPGASRWRSEHQSETCRILFDGLPVLAAKPQTFMNESGRAVKALLSHYKIAPERLLIISDDLDLPFARLRLRARGSAGGHNGLRSINAALGMLDYARLRVGIGRPTEGDPLEWVLSPFSPAEEREIPLLCENGATIVDAVVRDGVLAAMNQFNGQGPAVAEPPTAKPASMVGRPPEDQIRG